MLARSLRSPGSEAKSLTPAAVAPLARHHTPRMICGSIFSPAWGHCGPVLHGSATTTEAIQQRHDVSRLPVVEDNRPDKRKFKVYPIGYFHIDIAEVRTEQNKLYLFVAIDRTSKFAFVALHQKANRST